MDLDKFNAKYNLSLQLTIGGKMLTSQEDGRFEILVPSEGKPGDDNPDFPMPHPWPPVGPPARYCTMEEAGTDDIFLRDQKGQVVCTLAKICIDFRAYETNVDGTITRVTIASSTHVFARHNQWVKETNDPGSYTPRIEMHHSFYDAGYFNDPAHEHRIPLGSTDRICGRNIWFAPASWPMWRSDIQKEHLWLGDPLPTFDARGYLRIKYDPRLSGFCGP